MSAEFDRESVLQLMAWCQARGGSIPSTPEEVFALTELVIDDSWSDVDALPVSLSALTNLTHLTVRTRYHGVRPRPWPIAIDALENLTHLTLTGFGAGEGSDCWDNYPHLRHLDLSDNKISSLDDSFGSLAALETLVLRKCQGGGAHSPVLKLPDGLTQLSALKSLDVSYTRLETLPEDLGALTSLEALICHDVRELAALPESIGDCTNLRTLDLWNCAVAAIPESLAKLTRLETLELYGNGATSLPDDIGDLQRLSKLSLNSNALTAVPASLARCAAITELNLDNNALTEIPEEIGTMRALTALQLSQNALAALPSSLGALSSLVTLTAAGNRLTEVPEELGALGALRHLRIDGNSLRALPESLAGLTELRTLDASANQLPAMPTWIGELTELTALDFANNQLRTLPEGLSQLRALTKLELGDNDLASLPEALGALPLQELGFANNRVESLPADIIRRRASLKLSSAGNPLAETEKTEGIRLMKACLKRKLGAAKAAVLAGAGMDLTIGDCVDLGEDSFSGNWGPPALFWAAVVPGSGDLVELMLECGANPRGTWPYAGEWDPEDCYMDTSDAWVVTTLRELSEQGYSEALDTWSEGRKKLAALGIRRGDDHLELTPDPKALERILAATED